MNELPGPIVAVVDDDPSVLRSCARLLRIAGHDVITFGCAQDLLDYPSIDAIGCLVLDLELPDLNGLDLQSALHEADHFPPILFLTGHGDIRMTVRAMRAGAVDFLTKPCAADVLLAAVYRALQRHALERREREASDSARSRLEVLTPRECDVLRGIVAGQRNKEIAVELEICEKTVKVHRARILAKTQLRSVAELVRMADLAGLSLPGHADSQGPGT